MWIPDYYHPPTIYLNVSMLQSILRFHYKIFIVYNHKLKLEFNKKGLFGSVLHKGYADLSHYELCLRDVLG